MPGKEFKCSSHQTRVQLQKPFFKISEKDGAEGDEVERGRWFEGHSWNLSRKKASV